MHVVAYATAALLYLAASARYTMRFARARSGVTGPMAVIIYVGVLCHIIGFALYWARYAEAPLVGLGPSLATLALLIALALAVLGLFTAAQPIGLLLAPVAGLLLVLAMLAGVEPAGSLLAFRGNWLSLHVSLSFLGYAGWVVAAAAALMYLLQLRQIKHKRLGAVFAFFPPLSTLDRLAEWGLVLGFCAFTLGISLGWAWTVRFEGTFRWSDPKVVWGVAVWLALLVALSARFGGRGTKRQAAWWNLAGFGVVSLGYLVAKMIIPGSEFFL